MQSICICETTLWWVKTRDTNSAAKFLLNGLISLKGVPLTLRSDNAQEFVEGIVKELNTYLCIDQVKTGGYNPRGNSICERVNQTIGSVLRKCDDEH